MIHFSTIRPDTLEGSYQPPYQEAHTLFQKLYPYSEYHFLMESKRVSLFSGRFSLIGVDPVLKLIGKEEQFEIVGLNERSLHYFEQFTNDDFAICDDVELSNTQVFGRVKKQNRAIEESQRSKTHNIAQIIRVLLEKFKTDEKCLMGLYGAMSYDFVRLFEDLEDQLEENGTNDFTLFLYDSFVFFDHIRQETFLKMYRQTKKAIQETVTEMLNQIDQSQPEQSSYQISKSSFSQSPIQFETMVLKAKDYIRDGELFQVVLSNCLKAEFTGDPFALYLRYRETNPSPYLFYYNFGDQQLVGASPEMMVRYEDGMVHLRPIAGTAERGTDPVDDHEQMLSLLVNEKERAELDMLIDLGRNDLSRICKPGIQIADYRFVEKYSRVMHTVAHLRGELKEGYIGLDALFSCLNAGTLTGAPKVAAMRMIEKHEIERRGYYGGTVGQLTFSGEVDTGIIIRTAHIKDKQLSYQSGAGIVYDSDPAKEYQEVLNKAKAFLETFS
ncbi:MAG: anthranilate synthase component I family protein [bacterium]|nr:anthranilate synthase component I family protein [bacterium]